ncbi:MAG TPA: histidine kinase [Clostridiales bacterium]|nr:histidine kinase [Clostridiales bacterium]
MRVKIAVIICILIGIINTIGLYLINTSPKEKVREAKAGVLSLEQWDTEKYNIQISGEWEFYPGVLINPEQERDVFQEYSKQKRIMSLSKENFKETASDPSITTGTLRMIICLKDDNLYGINLGSTQDGVVAYINGNRVWNNGQSPHGEADNGSLYQTPVGFARSENRQLELVIQLPDIQMVGNWLSGTMEVPYIEFGRADHIMKMRDLYVSIDMFVISGYLILGIFFLGNYFFENKARYALFFSLFLLLQAVHAAGVGERLIFLVLPSPKDFMLFYEYEIQLLYLYTFCFLMFIYDFLRPYTSKKAVVFLSVLLLVVGPVFNWELFGIGGLPGITFHYHKLIISVIVAASNGYILWVMLKSLVKGVEAAEYVMVFTATFLYYVLTNFLNFLFGINIGKVSALLFLAMVVSLTLYLNYRLRLSYKQVEGLSRQLLLQDQDKDLFLARASRELESPLKDILTISNELLTGEEMPVQEQEAKLRRVSMEGWHAYSILEELMETFGEPLRKEDLNLEPVDAARFTELLEELQHLVPRHGMPVISRKIPEQFPVFLADLGRLKEVLYHLLHNAVKYTDNGEITLRINSVGTMVHITVEDTGTGIGNAQLSMIFAAFYKEKRQEPGVEGLGLGLTVAKKLVELMGGEIWAISEAGKGSAFSFSLPLAGSADRTKDREIGSVVEENREITLAPGHREELCLEEKESYKLSRTGPEVILAAGDIIHASGALEWLGEALDYMVTTVGSGQEALEYAGENRVDLVLIDLDPSGMSGYELCQELRKRYSISELPIIILGRTRDLDRAFQAGASDFLSKPVVWEELRARIEIRLFFKKAAEEAVVKELKNLHAQIMPHFLYNTLNTIIGLSYKDTEKTCEALQHLSVYFRAKLDFSGNPSIVALDQELELVKAYLAIEKMRFNERLELVYEIDETIHFMLPSLTLQPLVENAVHHGTIGNKAKITIRVSIQRDADRGYIIKISDDGPGIPEEKQQELLTGEYHRIGFSNVLKKIRLLKGADLWLDSGEDFGTCVTIYLAKEYQYGIP